MATITFPTTALMGTGGHSYDGKAAATILQGQILYKNTSGKYDLARANAAGTTVVAGVARNGATVDAPVKIQDKGVVTGLSGITSGTIYVLSDTVAGGVMPVADLTTGDQLSVVCIGISTTSVMLAIANSGVTAP
jgi:hypothetical protein